VKGTKPPACRAGKKNFTATAAPSGIAVRAIVEDNKRTCRNTSPDGQCASPNPARPPNQQANHAPAPPANTASPKKMAASTSIAAPNKKKYALNRIAAGIVETSVEITGGPVNTMRHFAARSMGWHGKNA
jgi:hypothetical protein